MKKTEPNQRPSQTSPPIEPPWFKPNLAVILFPDGTRARLWEFETYQPDGPKDAPSGVMVRLRSGRTILWSVSGSTAEQKTQHATDILEGLDQIFGRRNLAD